MPASALTRFQPRMQHLSRRLALGCLLLIITLPVAEAVYWAVADAQSLAVAANLMPQNMIDELLPWQRVAGAVLMGIPLWMLLAGVWQARKCFLLFAAGRVFTPDAIRHLRRFAGWAAASAAANIVCKAAVSVTITMQNAPGHRVLAVGIGSDQILLLFFAAMVWLMAALVGEGLRLADENASFI